MHQALCQCPVIFPYFEFNLLIILKFKPAGLFPTSILEFIPVAPLRLRLSWITISQAFAYNVDIKYLGKFLQVSNLSALVPSFFFFFAGQVQICQNTDYGTECFNQVVLYTFRKVFHEDTKTEIVRF